MSNTFADKRFSTTRCLSRVEPVIEYREGDKVEAQLYLPAVENAGGLRTQGYFKHSYKEKPLISIITIVYNGQAHIEQTIMSVLDQDYDNLEYIIIDGKSTDGTLNIIKKYEGYIDYWVSENDKGISDAFNKGVRCAFGELIGLINADDYYECGAIGNVANKYLEGDRLVETVLFGCTNKITLSGIKKLKNDNKVGWFMSAPFSHCSSFLTSSYYKKFGLFDTEYKIGMDVDLLMRGLRKAKYIGIEKTIATQRDGGISDANRLEGYKEYMKISKRHHGVILSVIGYLLKLIIFYKNKVLL